LETPDTEERLILATGRNLGDLLRERAALRDSHGQKKCVERGVVEAFSAGCTASTTPSVRSPSTTTSTQACRFLHAWFCRSNKQPPTGDRSSYSPMPIDGHQDGILGRLHPRKSVMPARCRVPTYRHTGEWYSLYQWITLNEALALIGDGMYFQPCCPTPVAGHPDLVPTSPCRHHKAILSTIFTRAARSTVRILARKFPPGQSRVLYV